MGVVSIAKRYIKVTQGPIGYSDTGQSDNPATANLPKKRISAESTSFGRKRAILVNFWAEMECCDPYFRPTLALSTEIISLGQFQFLAEISKTLSARIVGPNSGRN